MKIDNNEFTIKPRNFFTDITWGGKFTLTIRTDYSAAIENEQGKIAMSWGGWMQSTPDELKTLLDNSKLTKRLSKELKIPENELAPYIIKVLKTIFKY